MQLWEGAGKGWICAWQEPVPKESLLHRRAASEFGKYIDRMSAVNHDLVSHSGFSHVRRAGGSRYVHRIISVLAAIFALLNFSASVSSRQEFSADFRPDLLVTARNE